MTVFYFCLLGRCLQIPDGQRYVNQYTGTFGLRVRISIGMFWSLT